jgi:type 1 glutamine amidotransferase
MHVLLIGENHFDFHRLDDKRAAFEAILGQTDGIDLTVTTDREALSPGRLAEYDVVVDYLTDPPEDAAEALRAFVREGGGFVGLHSAADVSTFVEEPVDEIAALVGGRFVGHPQVSTFGVRLTAREHPILDGLEDFTIEDEPYDVTLESTADVTVLAEMEHPELAGTPVAWVRQEGDGRVFYCSLGHTQSAFETSSFRTMLRQGVLWTGG